MTGRDLNIGVDADDRGFDRTFKEAEEAAKGLDRELGKVARQQKLTEYATERASDAVRRYGRDQDKAALAARKAGDVAEKAAVRADIAIRRAAEAADKLANKEISAAAAAKAAAAAERAIERSALAAAAAHRAAARAADQQADQERQLARSGQSAAGVLVKGASLVASKWQDMSLLIKAGILALPVAATAAGAGISLGLGAGFAGGAIAMAAQNEKVKQQFTGLGKYVIADVKSWSVPYEGLLIRTASRAADAFDEIGPHVKDAFAELEPDVERFAQAALDAFGNLGPYVDRGVAAFHPLMTILSARLPGMIDNVANQLTRMTESVDPRAWDQLLGGVNGFISGAGNLVVALERVDSAYLALEGHSTAGARAQAAQADVWHQIGEKLGIVNPKVSELVPLENSAAAGMRNFGDNAKQAAAALQAWHNAVLGSYNSEIALEQSIDDANKTIKDNGATLDINTQKGRENKSALLAIGAAALQAADDAKKSGADSSAAMNRGYAAFIKAARGAGMTRAAAAALARQIGLVPSSKNIKFNTNAGAAMGAVAALQRRINNLRGTTVTNTVRTAYVDIGGGQRARIASGHYAMGGLVGYASGGQVGSVQAFPSGGQVKGLGTGTSDSNLIAASKGEFVVNARDTADNLGLLKAVNSGMFRIQKTAVTHAQVPRMTPRPAAPGGGGGGGVARVVLDIRGGDRELRKLIRAWIKNGGGDVQAVAGQAS